jgi:alpha-tubulin suppressor-like RCC1 family protein
VKTVFRTKILTPVTLTEWLTLFRSASLSQKGWTSMSMGLHHTLALDRDSKVYALGRYQLFNHY